MKNSRLPLLLATCLLSIVLFPGCKTAKPKPDRVTLIVQDEQDFFYMPKGTRILNAETGLNMAVNTNGFFISSPYAAKILDGVKLDQIGGDD